MTEISVGFTIVTPGSLNPGMHFGLEVKWLIIKLHPDFISRRYADDNEFTPGTWRKAILLVKLMLKCHDCSRWSFRVLNGSDFGQYSLLLSVKIICCNCHIHSVNVCFVGAEFRTGGLFEEIWYFIPLDLSCQRTDVCRVCRALLDSTTAGQWFILVNIFFINSVNKLFSDHIFNKLFF